MRSKPFIEVTCNNCPVTAQKILLEDCAMEDVAKELHLLGWYAGLYGDYCPDCAIALGFIDNDEVMMEATP